MKIFVVYLTFIPWILYFSLLCKDALYKLSNHKVSWKWIKKNIFSIFHFPNIILFLIFIYFSMKYSSANQIWITNILLFTAINLYLFINHYYDKYKSKDVGITSMSTVLIILIMVLIPIIYYVSTRNYVITYYILFIYSFFNYVIVYVAKLINEFLLKKVFNNDKE